MTTKLIEAGCDWLTATSGEQVVQQGMGDLWWLLKDHSHIARPFVKKAAWQGYMGERVEHGFFGEREDGSCVILSGPLARLYAKEFVEIGARPSRLDLQVTGLGETAPGKLVEQMFKQAQGFAPPNGRPPELKMWVGRSGAEGLYIGRRSSEAMLRVYDKGRESKQPAYNGALRVEAELKQGTARRYAGAWVAAEDSVEFVCGAVRTLAGGRGVTIPFEVGGMEVVLHKTSYISPTESKMAWLMKQVSPTVQALIDEVGAAAVLSVLFPDSVDKHNHSDIIQA